MFPFSKIKSMIPHLDKNSGIKNKFLLIKKNCFVDLRNNFGILAVDLKFINLKENYNLIEYN